MRRVFVIVLFLLFSCSSSEKSLVGTYISKRKIKSNEILEKYDYRVKGNVLKLKKDSSFMISTCGNIASGVWYVKQDSLFLKTLSNKFKIDSLNNLPESKELLRTENKKPIYYLIKKNELYKQEILIEDGKSLFFLDQLIKK